MSAQFDLAGQAFIALNNLLKVEGWCESGARAKQVIDQGLVTVNGVVELRRRCKIVSGQRVSFAGQTILVVDSTARQA
jgi:ribosome-associated protein